VTNLAQRCLNRNVANPQLDILNVLNPTVPARWQPTLNGLVEFIRIEKEIRKGDPHSAAANELREVHDRLLAQSAHLVEPSAIAAMTDNEARAIFAKSLLLVAQLKHSVASPEGIIDTAGSRTLELYESDFYAGDDVVKVLKARLGALLGIPSPDLDKIDNEVTHLSKDQDTKIRIMSAMRKYWGLSAKDGRGPIRELCLALFPAFPILGQYAELIVTNTHLFVCVPKIKASGHQEEQELAALEKIMKRMTPKQLANFPAFGFVNPAALDSEMLQSLARLSVMNADALREQMGKIVTVLRLEDLDQYIIHDTWGHGWQATLLQFEEMFKKLSDDAATFVPGADFPSDPKGQQQFFVNQIVSRLPAAMTGVLGEMLADVAEFKVIDLHPTKADLMPNSSFFKFQPTKLDLTFQDLEYFYGLTLRGFDDWAKRQAPETSAVWLELRRTDLAPEVGYFEENGALKINLYTRLAVNFLTVHQAIICAYHELQGHDPGGVLPLKSFRDLLLVATAVYFEEDRFQNMWKIDEFLFLKFIPLCRQFSG